MASAPSTAHIVAAEARSVRAAKAFFSIYLAVQIGVSAWFLWRGDWFAWRMFAASNVVPAVGIRYDSGREESWESFQSRTGKGKTYRAEAAQARFLVPYLCANAPEAVSIEVGTETYSCRR